MKIYLLITEISVSSTFLELILSMFQIIIFLSKDEDANI